MAITRPAFDFEGRFTQMPNAWLRDRRLSRRARGLLGEIWSHRAGWRITLKSLVAAGPEGRDAIVGAIRELRENGYLELTQQRAERGRFGEVDYVLADPFATAHGESGSGAATGPGSAGSGFSGSGESDPKNTSPREDHPVEDQGQEISTSVTYQNAGARGDDGRSSTQAVKGAVDISKVIARMTAICGREVDRMHAFALIGTALERAKEEPRDATAYVLGVLKNDAIGWTNYIDTGKVPS